MCPVDFDYVQPFTGVSQSSKYSIYVLMLTLNPRSTPCLVLQAHLATLQFGSSSLCRSWLAPSFSIRPFSISPLVKGLLPSLEGGVGPSLTGRGLASFGHTQNLQFLLPIEATGGTKRCQEKEWFPFLCPSPVEKSLIRVSLMEGLTIYTIYGILWPLGEFCTSSTS